MMLRTIACAAALCGTTLMMGAAEAAAQASRFSVEGRLGMTFPTGDLSDVGAESGLALGADLMYTFTPSLTAYAGLSRDAFSCDEDEEEGCEDDLTSSGFQAGLKFLLTREGRALPWLRAGILGHSLDTNGSDSDMGIGFEAGAGADLDVSPRWAIVPALHIRSYSPDFDGDDDISATWLALTLAAHLHF